MMFHFHPRVWAWPGNSVASVRVCPAFECFDLETSLRYVGQGRVSKSKKVNEHD